MSAFVPQEPIRIEHPDGVQWIAIKPKLSAGDKAAIEGKLVSMITDRSGRTAEAEFDLERGLMAALEVAIVDWHLLDDSGKPVPFNRKRIRDFDPDDPLIEQVQEEIAKRNPFGKRKGSGSTDSG